MAPPKVPDRKAAPGTFRRIVEIFKPYKGKVAFAKFGSDTDLFAKETGGYIKTGLDFGLGYERSRLTTSNTSIAWPRGLMP